MFKRGQVEHILTMANLKLKPSLFYLLPALIYGTSIISNLYNSIT